MQNTRSTLDHAREYARNGVYVYPVYVTRDADGKKTVRPAVASWRKQSSISQADVTAWWDEDLGAHPGAGIGIDCGKSGIVGVDCDGTEGIENWLSLDPPKPMGLVSTRKGQHWYYRENPDHLIGNDQDGTVAPGVDIRGVGGTLFAPGTPDYAWIDGPDWSLDAPVPQVVIDRMTAKKSPVPAVAVLESDDDLFDGVKDERRFTESQAVAFVKEAREKLAATERGYNGAINNFAMACAHFPWLIDRERCGRLMIKALGEKTGWTAPDGADMGTINSAYAATEQGRSWVATRVDDHSRDEESPNPGGEVNGSRLLVQSAAEMAYWLQANIGQGRMGGFFVRSGEMVHTPRVDQGGYVPAPDGGLNGPAEIRPVTAPVLAAKLQYMYDCYKVVDIKGADGKKTGETAEVAALFPVEAARRAVDAPEALDGLRALTGLTGTPMVRSDGSVLGEPGYDVQSGYLFLPGVGVDVPAVPDKPTPADVEAARVLLLGMVADFPFATVDDRANYLGLLLTPLLRQVAPPSYKMFGIGAHQPASGKSLLAELAGIIHGSVMRSEVPEDEAEWRKQTFSILSTTSAPLVVLDNIMGVLRSSVLAGVLTAGRDLTDRELGSSKTITVANDRVWVVTGNNLSLGGDLVRRTITILIDPDTPNPEQRTGFAVPDLRAWVVQNRNQVLHALLVLVRAWVAQGMPEPERKQSDSFARWERVIAGVLEVAGIPGQFDAESGKRAAAGGDDEGLAQVLDVLHEKFGSGSWQVNEALELKGEAGAGWVSEQRDWLPTPVLDKMARSEASGRKALGWWLRNRIGRWVLTSDGRSLVIREAGKNKKGAVWKIEER